MNKDIVMPKLSVKTDSGTLIAWLKDLGEQVEQGEVLFEVETEKAIHEVEAPFSGKLEETLVAEGDLVTTGDCIAKVMVEK